MFSYPKGFRCIQCGACCRAYIPVTRQDIMRWAVEGRDDILEHVSTQERFIHPVPGDELARCPFLTELPHGGIYRCEIHDTKPEACAGYPKSRELAQRMACPGIEQMED